MLGFQPLGRAVLSKGFIWTQRLALVVTEGLDTFAATGVYPCPFVGALIVQEANDYVSILGTGFSQFQGALATTEAEDIFAATIQGGAVPDYQDLTLKIIRRSDADYASGWFNLLPQGSAWPRLTDTVLYNFILGQSGIWGNTPRIGVDGRGADFLQFEADPRATVEMLTDWETAWGLPDIILTQPKTVEARQKALWNRYTMLGAQSPGFFVQQAKNIGYAIKIEEHSPFMCGISSCGDTRSAGNDSWFRWELSGAVGGNIRFYWDVQVLNPRLSWFRCGSGQCGIDPSLRIGIYEDLEALMHRYAPAHTSLSFDYSGLIAQDVYAGTP